MNLLEGGNNYCEWRNCVRKFVVILLIAIFIILCTMTIQSVNLVIRTNVQLPPTVTENQEPLRIVLITNELETPFWDQISKGAKDEALQREIHLEVWGSFAKNQVDFLKKIEIAIASKVDGLIVQGNNTEAFRNLIKLKAAFYGIPVILIANDVPIQESLRSAYVGSNHFKAGQLLAKQLLAEMGNVGRVLVFGEKEGEYSQSQRVLGIRSILQNQKQIELNYVESEVNSEAIATTIKTVLNESPNWNALIGVQANMLTQMLQEVGRRTRLSPYFIYSFDDAPESAALMKNGFVDGLIKQDPEAMGRKSVQVMQRIIAKESLLLEQQYEYTPIQMVKAANVK
jgi:ribose transport system substrate-binding protein